MFPSTVLIEFFCLFFAILYVRKKKTGYWHYFIWFMAFTVLIEGSGWAMAVYLKKSNHWLYNISLPVEFFFITWIFYNVFKPLINSKPWALGGLTVLSVSCIIESFDRKFLVYNNFTATLESVLFIIASGVYFYLLLRCKEYINLMKFPAFWFVSGVFLFYFGSTAINIFFDDLMQLNIAKGIPLRYLIFTVLNGILYGCWSYAFRCRYLQTI